MGWDNLNNINLNSKPTIDSSKDGFQEYEVEQDIVFTVKYKVLAKDNSDLIDNKIYLAQNTTSIGKACDIAINWFRNDYNIGVHSKDIDRKSVV